MTYWCLMIRLANLLQAPTVSVYQLVKTKTFALYLFDMVKRIKWKWKNAKTLNKSHILFWYFHCWIEQVNTSCVNNRNSSYCLSRGSLNLPNVRTRKQNDTTVQKHGIRYWDRSSPPEVLLGKGVLKIYSKFTGQHPCDFNRKQLYWNHTLAWVFPCKFAAYFQNTLY